MGNQTLTNESSGSELLRFPLSFYYYEIFYHLFLPFEHLNHVILAIYLIVGYGRINLKKRKKVKSVH